MDRKLASCHHSGAYNYEGFRTFLERIFTSIVGRQSFSQLGRYKCYALWDMTRCQLLNNDVGFARDCRLVSRSQRPSQCCQWTAFLEQLAWEQLSWNSCPGTAVLEQMSWNSWHENNCPGTAVLEQLAWEQLSWNSSPGTAGMRTNCFSCVIEINFNWLMYTSLTYYYTSYVQWVIQR